MEKSYKNELQRLKNECKGMSTFDAVTYLNDYIYKLSDSVNSEFLKKLYELEDTYNYKFTVEEELKIVNADFDNLRSAFINNGNINIKIEDKDDEIKMLKFCANNGIDFSPTNGAIEGNYVFIDENKLFNTDEFLIDEDISIGIEQCKVNFKDVSENLINTLNKDEKEMIDLLKIKIHNMNPDNAFRTLDHYIYGFTNTFSKECIKEIEGIKSDYTRDIGNKIVDRAIKRARNRER